MISSRVITHEPFMNLLSPRCTPLLHQPKLNQRTSQTQILSHFWSDLSFVAQIGASDDHLRGTQQVLSPISHFSRNCPKFDTLIILSIIQLKQNKTKQYKTKQNKNKTKQNKKQLDKQTKKQTKIKAKPKQNKTNTPPHTTHKQIQKEIAVQPLIIVFQIIYFSIFTICETLTDTLMRALPARFARKVGFFRSDDQIALIRLKKGLGKNDLKIQTFRNFRCLGTVYTWQHCFFQRKVFIKDCLHVLALIRLNMSVT